MSRLECSKCSQKANRLEQENHVERCKRGGQAGDGGADGVMPCLIYCCQDRGPFSTGNLHNLFYTLIRYL